MTWYEVALSDPDRIAIIDGDRKITFGELRVMVNKIAASWDELDCPKGGTIAVVLPNCWEMLPIELAALSTERYLVPVNRHLTAPEIAYILGNCRPSFVVTSPELLPTVDAAAAEAGIPGTNRVYTTEPTGDRAFSAIWQDKPDADPADRRAGSVMFYSSGTTGRPKGIRRELSGATPEQEAAAGVVMSDALNLTDGPGVHGAVAPMYHSAPNAMAIGALGRGVTVAFPGGSHFDESAFLRFIGQVGMTESFVVPTMFVRLLRLPEAERAAYDPSALRAVVHAGAPCPVPVKHQMIQWWGPVLEEFYGSTESSAITAVHSPEWLEAPGTVGRAVPGYEIQIRDAAGRILPAGEEGLIYSLGSRRFDYVGDPDKTAASWDDEALLLGDVGKMDEEGRLFILDRRTDLILSGGVNIYPAEIEFALLEHPEIDDIAVVGVPDDEWGQRVVAVVQPSATADRAQLEESIAKFAEGVLAKYKRPRQIRIIDQIPRMPTGKISRTAIRQEVLDSVDA